MTITSTIFCYCADVISNIVLFLSLFFCGLIKVEWKTLGKTWFFTLQRQVIIHNASVRCNITVCHKGNIQYRYGACSKRSQVWRCCRALFANGPMTTTRLSRKIKFLLSVGKNHNQTCNINNLSTLIVFDQSIVSYII